MAYNVTSLKLVRCFKPTSKTRFYDAEPIRLSGVLQYNAGEIAGLNEPRTIIDPERTYDISYDALRRSEWNGQFHLVGKMPADFATRMIAAVNGKKEWRQRQRRDFLSWFPTQD
ncbi:MAG: hypothetical protein JNK48_09825 [Bryobacterales bacterium]|nr:hypothetical protein [Bryobacterales bacterium]